MRIVKTIAPALVVGILVASLASAGPGIGFSLSPDFQGTGTAASPIAMSTNVTMPGVADVAGTAGATTLTVEGDRTVLAATRTQTAGTTDDKSAIYGVSTGTMAVPAGNLYNYGLRGVVDTTKSSGAGNLHDWSGFFRCGVEGGSPNVAYECIGVNGVAFEGTGYTVGGSFRSGTQNGTSMAVFGQGDTAGTGASFGSYGYARTGDHRVGVIGVAPTGGATSNIGVWARLGAYTETVPAGSAALYVDGVSTYTDDATFEAGTCVINSLGITCGGTLITPGADITSVTAGNGLTGGGTSGAVTLDVAVGTGLSVAADQVNLNLAGASCSAGSFVSAISATGTGTCTAEPGDITSVTVNSPLSGGGASGAVTIGMANGDRGDITTTTGSQTGDTWTIDNDVVTYQKMQNVSATARFLGRITAGAGDPEELTGTQATSLLDQASTVATTKGVVPGSNGATTNFLRGDMTWAAVSSGITNGGSANYYAKSDGTNLVNGTIKDDGTSVTFNTTAGGTTAKVTITDANGNMNLQGTLDVAGAFTVANGSTGFFKDNSQHEKQAIINHVVGFGTAPTITSGCGTGATRVGTDSTGRVTTGNPGAATCRLTFVTTWGTAPNCFYSNTATDGAMGAAGTTTTYLEFSVLASTTYRWWCFGY